MTGLTKKFLKIRNDLSNNMYQFTEVFFPKFWDPITNYVLIRELNKMIQKDLRCKYPKFPVKFLPQVKFRTCEEDLEIEAGVQIFLNTTPNLIFLGCTDVEEKVYDFYIQKSYDPNFSYIFHARYGHEVNEISIGTNKAAVEYLTGNKTPLAIAFELAVYDRYIK